MATNSKSAHGIGNLGKRVFNQIWTANSRDPIHFSTPSASSLTIRRGAHSSVYDKNPDDQVRPSVVPDDVIQPQSDKYWAPHPKTGVFGPAAEHNTSASDEHVAKGGDGSVLEEQAWFRPTSLEDLEKPVHH